MNISKAVTDERMVIDVEVPGFGKDDITVKTAYVNGGQDFKITIKGAFAPRKNADGDAVPLLGFDKKVEKTFKVVFSASGDYGEALNRNAHFNPLDYSLDKLAWGVDKGVLRISIPKTDVAIGKAVEASGNPDAASTGTPSAPADTAPTADED